ncbi:MULTISPECIES: LexA family protein [Pseudomonas]|uniref:S24 family peptidase n=1 Tax=Pseudomonas piscis TaxID=2614538 RepID=A0ABY9NDE2_9PSED|nr:MULTISPECIES: LexA family transcriptional regulator [Pseudomonas]POA53821.1 Cro/Cl family transcriptional regulator [Pseudomonas sp. FW507-12TSA]WMN15763.1 S24 family peptidase [Pseudomonas piscis]
MDKWIELVKANMKGRKVTQEKLAERLGMSQGGIGHWLSKRRQPKIEDMNRVLEEIGMGFLEVVLVVREKPLVNDDGEPLEQEPSLVDRYNPYFRYPVSDWRTAGEVREDGQPSYVPERYELSDYQAQGAAFWLMVVGDAMIAPSGMSISQGMLILVDPAIAAEPGKLVVVQCPGSAEALFRKLVQEGGQRYLAPLNPTYPKMLYSDECRIIGVVVQATAKF